MTTQKAFDDIYTQSTWGYKSGPGSDPANAQTWIDTVNTLLTREDIVKVFDIGCGDWRLGEQYNLDGKFYIGMDVSAFIVNDIQQHAKDNVSFIQGDAEVVEFPESDLILIKDVLQHLSLASIKIIMDKILTSCKYALICNDIGDSNTDIANGGYRRINLEVEPFDYKLEHLVSYEVGSPLKQISLYTRQD